MVTPAENLIVLDSDEDSDDSYNDVELHGGLADERPPSDDDYESSIALSSGEEEQSNDEAESDNAQDDADGVANNVPTASPSAVDKQNTEEKPTEKPNSENEPKKKKKKSSPKKKTDSKGKKPRKKAFERRNIRKILADAKLEKDTVNAQKEEEDRKKRLAERFQMCSDAPNLKSLLTECPAVALEQHSAPKPLIVLSSDEEDDEDCCIIVNSATDRKPILGDDRRDDPENSGIHVDDSKNQPDELNRVLVNVTHPAEDPDLFLSPQIAATIKPHQIGGIRFLYDNLVESLRRFKNSEGFGCILAHSMGLGKTIQVVGFTDVFMRFTNAKRVLIIVPINTLQNWVNEFDMWLPSPDNIGEGMDEVQPRTFNLYILNDTQKTLGSRAKVIEKWTVGGGVLLMGYEMFRRLASCKSKTRKRKVTAGPELIDMDAEETNAGLQLDMQQALLDPGPDLIVCDEGHRIKNSHAGISKTLKQINTKRRVVLTGYPLQNNLTEYWCMVDFVRPNFLGTKVEFCNMFERPISNGQCADSTPTDVKLMRYRAHVLHKLLEGFVQRRNHKVLQSNLPSKEEWVLMIKMSEFQRKIYNLFMENIRLDSESCIGGTNPLKAFAVACKIWNHPDVMHTFLDKKADNDIDLLMGLMSNGSPVTNGAAAKKIKKSASESALSLKASRRDSPLSAMFGMSERTSEITYDWVKPAFESYSPGVVENSGKFVILFQVIEETLARGEKLLVFSQSLMALNLLEEFLSKMPVPLPWLEENWAKSRTYFRLDGSTNASERERLINQFNSVDNRNVNLFLISTKAGCLGINLVGANRVVMLDASWNPCHDCQAVCRVYRYGQIRPCYIYRFVTDNTMERKIYDRQVSKQGMAERVIDEVQVQSQFSKKENDQLLEYQDRDMDTIDPTGAKDYSDGVLRKVVEKNHRWVSLIPFTHESLLIEAQDQRMTRADKQDAQMSYEVDKKRSISYPRQSYLNRPPPPPPVFRGPTLPPLNPSPILRPSTSTPQMTTPLPPYGYPGSVQHRLKDNVIVQTISAHKDILVPSAEGQVIKKGDLLVVIRTPKGIYIKLSDGKLFAVRNRHEAEDLGIASAEPPVPPTVSNGSDHRLTNLLQNSGTRPIAPNFVERRRQIIPQTTSDSFLPLGAGHSLVSNAGSSHDADDMNTGSPSLPMTFTPYQSMPTPVSSPFALTDGNFLHHQATNGISSTSAVDLTNPFGQPAPSQYPIGGYQSQCNQHVGYGWPHSTSTHSDINGTSAMPYRHAMTPPPLPFQTSPIDTPSLPSLQNLLQLRPPLVIPPLDEPEEVRQPDIDSDESLPSLSDSPTRPTFSVGKENG